jgi:hypothetical protein
MENTIGQQISNHLELLGYEIKDESKEDECKFSAIIESLNPLSITIKKDFVFIITSYGTWKNEILNSLAFHNLIHKANHTSTFARWYPHKMSDGSGVAVGIETCFLGYEKKSFGKIIASFNADINKHVPDLIGLK